MTLAAAWVVVRATRTLPFASEARRATLYAIGSLAAFWTCMRVVAILG